MTQYLFFLFKFILIVIWRGLGGHTGMLSKTHFDHCPERAGGSHWFIETSTPAPQELTTHTEMRKSRDNGEREQLELGLQHGQL